MHTQTHCHCAYILVLTACQCGCCCVRECANIIEDMNNSNQIGPFAGYSFPSTFFCSLFSFDYTQYIRGKNPCSSSSSRKIWWKYEIKVGSSLEACLISYFSQTWILRPAQTFAINKHDCELVTDLRNQNQTKSIFRQKHFVCCGCLFFVAHEKCAHFIWPTEKWSNVSPQIISSGFGC